MRACKPIASATEYPQLSYTHWFTESWPIANSAGLKTIYTNRDKATAENASVEQAFFLDTQLRFQLVKKMFNFVLQLV